LAEHLDYGGEGRRKMCATVHSRHQSVTAPFSDEEDRGGGIILDLLPEPINMALERVGGYVWIVALHLL